MLGMETEISTVYTYWMLQVRFNVRQKHFTCRQQIRYWSVRLIHYHISLVESGAQCTFKHAWLD